MTHEELENKIKELEEETKKFKKQLAELPMPKTKITKIYLHSDKESMYEAGRKLGLKDGALDNFEYAFYEAEVEIEVDMKTGHYKILKFRG